MTTNTDQVPAAYHASVTSKRDDLTTLGTCWREFWRHFSPRAVAAAFVITLIARFAVGEWSYHDAIVPVVLIAAQPFVEWLIHKYLLHLPPLELFGKRYELYASTQHRRHHRSPAVLYRVLLKPAEVIGAMISIVVLAPPIVLASAALLGGKLLPLTLSAIALSLIGLFRYEWSHFLIHTPYVPKSAWYRKIWRNHRLHHFKHEGYWMGVTSNLGDRVLGTNPDQRTIPRSPTARTLGVETD